MTLEEYRKECGWSQNEMARQAGIDANTLRRALTGKSISVKTARALAAAISRELSQTVRFQDIEQLNVKL